VPGSEAPHHPVPLHEAARRLLAGWQAPDREQDRVRRLMLDFLADHPDGTSRSCQAGHLVASAVVLDPTGTRVLLTRHPAHGLWIELGGHLEPNDATVAAAALREALEESASPACTWTPPPSTWKSPPTTAHPADRAATSTSGSGLPHPLPANPCAAMSPWTSPGSTSPTYPHRSGSPYAAASTAPRSTCPPGSSWRQRPSHTPAGGITARGRSAGSSASVGTGRSRGQDPDRPLGCIAGSGVVRLPADHRCLLALGHRDVQLGSLGELTPELSDSYGRIAAVDYGPSRP